MNGSDGVHNRNKANQHGRSRTVYVITDGRGRFIAQTSDFTGVTRYELLPGEFSAHHWTNLRVAATIAFQLGYIVEPREAYE